MERDSGLIGTSLALQNLLLAAHAAGLGASGMTGPLVAADGIREQLAVPPSWHPVALVPIGYPAEAPPATERKPVEQAIAKPASVQVAPQPVAPAPEPVAAIEPKPEPVAAVVHRDVIPVRTDDPRLPPALLRERPSGVVRVSFELNPDGSTGNVKVVSSTNRSLNRVSVDAVSNWKFQPVDEVLSIETELAYKYD